MRNKKEERTPILYEKYKQANEKKQEIYVTKQPQKSPGKRMGDLLIILILLGMVGLAAVGMVTLLIPEMRVLLIDFIGR